MPAAGGQKTQCIVRTGTHKNRSERIGVAFFRTLGIDGTQVSVEGLAAMDGASVFDIKLSLPGFLPRGDLAEPVWTRELTKNNGEGSCDPSTVSLPSSLRPPRSRLPGRAALHFGRNVSIGGYDFSHQTFDSRSRAVVHLYDSAPSRQGCASRVEGHGERVKVGHLRRIARP